MKPMIREAATVVAALVLQLEMYPCAVRAELIAAATAPKDSAVFNYDRGPHPE